MSDKKVSQGTAVQLRNFPVLSPKLKNRVLVGIRPFRKGGIRLEHQKIGSKNVIYNYGHGGAGVSLAPACGVETAQIAAKVVGPSKKVAVLGAGILGLFSALQCVDKGMSVTIYADRIPIPNQKTVLNMITSQIAPGYWLPFNYQFSDLDQHRRRTEISFKKYNEWVKKSKNIYEIQCYEQMTDQLFKQSAPDFIINTSKHMKLKLGNKQFDVINFKTLQLNLQLYLQDMLQQCKKKGIKFEKKHLSSISDLQTIKQDTIIACLGLYSKKIFNDNNVYGLKGHLIELRNITGIKAVFGFQFNGGQIGLYCLGDKVLIGFSMDRDEEMSIKEDTVKILENRAYDFYKYIGLDVQPKL